MKKLLVSFGIFIILILGITAVWALNEESFKLQFTIMNNSKNEDVDVYLLLPQEYIEFTIQKANLKIENYYGERGVLTYNGANTLKQNTIPGITVEKTRCKMMFIQKMELNMSKLNWKKTKKKIMYLIF